MKVQEEGWVEEEFVKRHMSFQHQMVLRKKFEQPLGRFFLHLHGFLLHPQRNENTISPLPSYTPSLDLFHVLSIPL